MDFKLIDVEISSSIFYLFYGNMWRKNYERRVKTPTRDHHQTAHTHHYTRGQDTQRTREDTIA